MAILGYQPYFVLLTLKVCSNACVSYYLGISMIKPLDLHSIETSPDAIIINDDDISYDDYIKWINEQILFSKQHGDAFLFIESSEDGKSIEYIKSAFEDYYHAGYNVYMNYNLNRIVFIF